jgi:hypothetical protein
MHRNELERGWLWYAKFIFASLAAGFATWMLVLITSLFIGGAASAEKMDSRFPRGGGAGARNAVESGDLASPQVKL